MKRKYMLKTILVTALWMMTLAACAEPPAGNADSAGQSVPSSGSNADVSGTSGWELQIDTTTLDGDAVTSDDFADNKLTVMNVWATWCPPCVDELPHLQEMSKVFADKDVEVIGVLQDGVSELGVRSDKSIASAQKLLLEAGADYRVILPDTVIMETFIAQMQYFPTTFFLDGEGNVVETVIGARDAAEWEEMINGALEKVSQ